MKSIMISIKPEWVAKILNGDKTIEIRKTMPKCELPCKVYIYCTKQSRPLVYGDVRCSGGYTERYTQTYNWSKKDADRIWGNLQGKVVAEFTLNKVDLLVDIGAGIHYSDKDYNLLSSKELLKKSCLTEEQIYNYVGENRRNHPFLNDGYAWHIDDLKIYDEPKELSEFRKDLDCDDYPCNKNKYCEHCYFDWSEGCSACAIDFDGEHCIYKTLKRPPQSWCYVE